MIQHTDPDVIHYNFKKHVTEEDSATNFFMWEAYTAYTEGRISHEEYIAICLKMGGEDCEKGASTK
jgi:hypothetical protein